MVGRQSGLNRLHYDTAFDERYTWNVAMLRDLRAQNIPMDWFITLVQGFVDRQNVTDNLSVMLIARRRQLRGGVRFFHRGIDELGNVANYVELEYVATIKEDYKQIL